ncbi:hypothetical protein V7968_09385 [Nocardia vulneris]|uniref:hypothetical protein n=1 Tax=Nocardia vulneris TaxID=1141657 RepID=UPI0030CB71E7
MGAVLVTDPTVEQLFNDLGGRHAQIRMCSLFGIGVLESLDDALERVLFHTALEPLARPDVVARHARIIRIWV